MPMLKASAGRAGFECRESAGTPRALSRPSVPHQIMRLGHRLAQFLQNRLEKLLGGLLAMATAFIVERFVAAT
jgi:hypothetical protein